MVLKKEIVIDGSSSDWFEKAVFTLKEEDRSKVPKNLFSYAEELVEKQLKKFPSNVNIKGETNKRVHEVDEKKLLQQAYEVQAGYAALKNKEKSLKRREAQIHCFFILSIGICIISVIALACNLIFG